MSEASDSKILGCVLRNLASDRYKMLRKRDPLWVKVVEMCGVGSTNAMKLCQDFDLDPYSYSSLGKTKIVSDRQEWYETHE